MTAEINNRPMTIQNVWWEFYKKPSKTYKDQSKTFNFTKFTQKFWIAKVIYTNKQYGSHKKP